jgi:hypothetical protein
MKNADILEELFRGMKSGYECVGTEDQNLFATTKNELHFGELTKSAGTVSSLQLVLFYLRRINVKKYK